MLWVLVLLVVGFVGGYMFKINKARVSRGLTSDTISPYSGEEMRGIKSLSQSDREGLLKGEGTPFGGMAKLAELNGFPGPRHVLDMAQEIELTESQENEIKKLYEEMKEQAIVLGEKIIGLEQEMNDGFANETIAPDELEAKLIESAETYGQLRFVHLKYHFLTKDILTTEQVQKYNEFRGYTGDSDPCENVPEGHDAELWKMHNNCS